MLSNAYFLAKFRFDTAENEPAKKLQILLIFPILLTLTPGQVLNPAVAERLQSTFSAAEFAQELDFRLVMAEFLGQSGSVDRIVWSPFFFARRAEREIWSGPRRAGKLKKRSRISARDL